MSDKPTPVSFCDKCGKPTAIKLFIPHFPDRSEYPVMCDCQQAEAKRQEQIEKQNKLDEKRARAFHGRIRTATFEQADNRSGEAFNMAKNYAKKFKQIRNERVNGLVFYGKTRQGKTFLSECITNAVVDQGFSASFCTAAEMVQMSQKNIQEMRVYNLNIIDDIGAERDTSFSNEIILSAVDKIVQNKAPLIVTTNYTSQEMANADDLHTQRLFGRILEHCLPVKVESDKSASRNNYSNILEILSK